MPQRSKTENSEFASLILIKCTLRSLFMYIGTLFGTQENLRKCSGNDDYNGKNTWQIYSFHPLLKNKQISLQQIEKIVAGVCSKTLVFTDC